ncbi:hypothetical protein HPP92_008616 [Vanilla planifolia]|uniref:Uncharacterized protein n=1 Tax=Vanilla planifolia TaxID=51239 RepID=A0A835V824_VANPL|nr:hypothetical protein HPP92_008616 [Vanilla planifolia]
MEVATDSKTYEMGKSHAATVKSTSMGMPSSACINLHPCVPLLCYRRKNTSANIRTVGHTFSTNYSGGCRRKWKSEHTDHRAPAWSHFNPPYRWPDRQLEQGHSQLQLSKQKPRHDEKWPPRTYIGRRRSCAKRARGRSR